MRLRNCRGANPCKASPFTVEIWNEHDQRGLIITVDPLND
jgi:hypothetical protein